MARPPAEPGKRRAVSRPRDVKLELSRRRDPLADPAAPGPEGRPHINWRSRRRGSGVADAIRREIEVVPDGRRVEQVASGTLTDAVSPSTLAVPDNAIEGSVRAIVKLYPSSFSQVVEGLDAIFQMPSGCFEQTSSTTYPNVLALDYLRRTGKSLPEVEAEGAAVHPRRLPAAGQLRSARRRVRLVRPPAREPHADGLRPDGVPGHGPRARRGSAS